jgi:hypothetical protein
MSALDDLVALPPPPKREPARPTHPKGWEPGITWDGTTGSITTAPLEAEPDPAVWAELIADWNLDPTRMEIVDDTIEFRGWDAAIGGGAVRRMRYYKAKLRRRFARDADRIDVDALCAQIMRRRPARPQVAVEDRAFIACLSDWQIGKGEGDGTAGTVDRILAAADLLRDRVKALKPSIVYVVGMGDISEQCLGHYPSQTFTADLDRREQMRVARRLITACVDAVIAAPRVVLSAVPGNHGENRNGAGKAYTTITDNDDLAVFENVAEVLAANPDRYGHVSTVLANDATLTLDCAGVPVAFRHGHIGGHGTHGAHKIEDWWKSQALGRQDVADAQILVSAHYHHFLCSESTGRTVLQCPAMDPGSSWWRRITGAESPAGMLTFGVGAGYGVRRWGDLQILSGEAW